MRTTCKSCRAASSWKCVAKRLKQRVSSTGNRNNNYKTAGNNNNSSGNNNNSITNNNDNDSSNSDTDNNNNNDDSNIIRSASPPRGAGRSPTRCRTRRRSTCLGCGQMGSTLMGPLQK